LRRFLGNNLYMYSHGHGISSVVVTQLTLAVRQVLYISNPTLEFLTWISCGILIFIVRDRTSVTKILNVSIVTIKFRLHKFFRIDSKITDEIPGPSLYM
jgi:hypothetical protein